MAHCLGWILICIIFCENVMIDQESTVETFCNANYVNKYHWIPFRNRSAMKFPLEINNYCTIDTSERTKIGTQSHTYVCSLFIIIPTDGRIDFNGILIFLISFATSNSTMS